MQPSHRETINNSQSSVWISPGSSAPRIEIDFLPMLIGETIVHGACKNKLNFLPFFSNSLKLGRKKF